MKIIFICGSLEIGKDGVGDYTRKLASEMINQGHQCAIVGLMDRFVKHQKIEVQHHQNSYVNVIRLPYNRGYSMNCKQVRHWIYSFNPDWISLQYVPFSFHNKGLPIGLGKVLKKAFSGWKFHVMFHELWIEKKTRQPLKKRIWSYLQKYNIKSFITVLQPTLVHTHLPIYQERLKGIGTYARALSLFSNIDVVRNPFPKAPERFKLAFFSQVAVSSSLIEFINDFIQTTIAFNLSPELILIGGSKTRMQKYVKDFELLCPELAKVSCTGFLSEVAISQALANCDLGLTPVPTHALGKSGSIAAFFAHGIPVAAPIVEKENNESQIGFFSAQYANSVLLDPNWQKFEEVKKAVLIAQNEIHISAIANIFSSDLEENYN